MSDHHDHEHEHDHEHDHEPNELDLQLAKAIDDALEEIIVEALGPYPQGSYEPGSAARALLAAGLVVNWDQLLRVESGDMLLFKSESITPEMVRGLVGWFNSVDKEVLVAAVGPTSTIDVLPGVAAALNALVAYDENPEMEFEDVMAAARPYLDARSEP